MNFRTKHVKPYLLATLLCFLILKLVLGAMLLYIKGPVLSVPGLDSRPALAEDAGRGTSKGPSDQDPLLPSRPSLNSQNVSASLKILERRRAEIEMERRQLESERKQLTALKEEIEAKLVQLSKIQDSIQSKLETQETIRNDKIKHLIKIYTTMAPKKAAALIEKLDMEVIIELFSKMKGENVGKILPYVSAEKAARISERLANFND